MTWICCSGVTARALSRADSTPRRFTNRWRSTLQGIRKGQGWRAVVSGGNRTAGWSPVTPSISTPCLGRAEKMRQVPLRTSVSRVVPAPPERTSCTISAQAMAALQDMASAAQGTLPGSSASNGAPAPPASGRRHGDAGGRRVLRRRAVARKAAELPSLSVLLRARPAVRRARQPAPAAVSLATFLLIAAAVALPDLLGTGLGRRRWSLASTTPNPAPASTHCPGSASCTAPARSARGRELETAHPGHCRGG